MLKLALCGLLILALSATPTVSADEDYKGGKGPKAKAVVVINESIPVDVLNFSGQPIPVLARNKAYRFIGATNFALHGNAGHRAMNEACQDALANAKARLCTSKEILNTTPLPVLGFEALWVQPIIVGYASPMTFVDYSGRMVSGYDGALSCNSWDRNTDQFAGLIWSRDTHFRFGRCNFSRHAACCAPSE